MNPNTTFHYVIVNTVTGKLHKKDIHSYGTQYPTERGAKIVATKLTKKTGEKHEVELGMNFKPKMRKVKSLMSGVDIAIEEDTPACCDPSTETYWSM